MRWLAPHAGQGSGKRSGRGAAEGLVIGEKTFTSRLILGTGKYEDFETMARAFEESGTQLVTVAIRRVNLDRSKGPSLLDHVDTDRISILPNTAGCYTAKDAILTAQLAREALGTELIKLEVIGDDKTLFPDTAATLEAARTLIQEGFTVLPYITDDPVACLRLQEIGCAAVMPLGAPIGSGLGIRNQYNIRIILEQAEVPVIVDAGVGTASDVSVAMEMGCDAVLLNTAVAQAGEPVKMARAMRHAMEAGRLAYESGRIPRRLYATASSPLEGVIETGS
ncbi:MAG: thiazole synthase [Candidatus Eisenbacteria bacterium]|nr:thiazole synthase [Candidatus Eisenbacteria bacterium]